MSLFLFRHGNFIFRRGGGTAQTYRRCLDGGGTMPCFGSAGRTESRLGGILWWDMRLRRDFGRTLWQGCHSSPFRARRQPAASGRATLPSSRSAARWNRILRNRPWVGSDCRISVRSPLQYVACGRGTAASSLSPKRTSRVSRFRTWQQDLVAFMVPRRRFPHPRYPPYACRASLRPHPSCLLCCRNTLHAGYETRRRLKPRRELPRRIRLR